MSETTTLPQVPPMEASPAAAAPAVPQGHKIHLVPAWAVKLVSSGFGLLVLLLVGLIGLLVVQQVRQERKDAARDARLEVVEANLQVICEQTAIKDIIAAKLPKLTPEVHARLAEAVWDFSRKNNCKSWLVLGLIEKESTWEPGATSPKGAMGLMQLMPATAYAMARIEGIEITNASQFYDPYTNVRLGLRTLQMNYKAAVLVGRSPDGDFTRSLYDYNGGGEVYARLVMEKCVPYQKLLSAPLAGKLKAPNE